MLLFTLGEMNGEVEVLVEGFKVPQTCEYHVTSITKCPTFVTLDNCFKNKIEPCIMNKNVKN